MCRPKTHAATQMVQGTVIIVLDFTHERDQPCTYIRTDLEVPVREVTLRLNSG